jgi:hypothetical protein
VIGAHEIHRACRSEDAGLLSELAQQDPASVLYHLDVAMRGSREGRRVPWSLVEETRTTAELEHESWLCRQDAVLRERARGAARAADLRTLRAAYGAGELFLVLGAGVSMAAGMPDWRGLVDGVLGLSLSWREGLIEAARAKRMGRIGNSVRILATEEDVERYARDLPAVPPQTRAAIEQTRAALAKPAATRTRLSSAQPLSPMTPSAMSSTRWCGRCSTQGPCTGPRSIRRLPGLSARRLRAPSKRRGSR